MAGDIYRLANTDLPLVAMAVLSIELYWMPVLSIELYWMFCTYVPISAF